MNKEQFLDILTDYLKDNFTSDEIHEILRDYKEYFTEGAKANKSDAEIIAGLGSPKVIAEELINENISKQGEKSIPNSEQNFLYKLKTTIKDKLNKLNICKLKKDNRTFKVLLSLVLLPIVCGIGFLTIGTGAFLIISLLLGIASIPFANSLAHIMVETKMLLISAGIAFIGFQILAWQLYTAILKLEFRATKRYRNWITGRDTESNNIIEVEELEDSTSSKEEGAI